MLIAVPAAGVNVIATRTRTLAEATMRIGILGSGLMGAKLGTLFARAGHRVTFSYSRDQRKLQRLAREAGNGASAGTPAEAAAGADAVLLAVHWLRVRDVLKQAGGLNGRVIVSCTMPMTADDSDLAIGRTSSGAEALQKMAPRAKVVGAFNTVPSEVLFGVFASRRRKPRPQLLYYGDDARAKRVAARLIRDVGFDPLDLGPLSMARYAEPFTLVVARLAYENPGVPQIAYRFERFKGRRRP
jgi:predicted dinucleotide-binding enzyme